MQGLKVGCWPSCRKAPADVGLDDIQNCCPYGLTQQLFNQRRKNGWRGACTRKAMFPDLSEATT